MSYSIFTFLFIRLSLLYNNYTTVRTPIDTLFFLFLRTTRITPSVHTTVLQLITTHHLANYTVPQFHNLNIRDAQSPSSPRQLMTVIIIIFQTVCPSRLSTYSFLRSFLTPSRKPFSFWAMKSWVLNTWQTTPTYCTAYIATWCGPCQCAMRNGNIGAYVKTKTVML